VDISWRRRAGFQVSPRPPLLRSPTAIGLMKSAAGYGELVADRETSGALGHHGRERHVLDAVVLPHRSGAVMMSAAVPARRRPLRRA